MSYDNGDKVNAYIQTVFIIIGALSNIVIAYIAYIRCTRKMRDHSDSNQNQKQQIRYRPKDFSSRDV
jgi:uncharacterized membrane protein YidH (DUF202 family)